MIDARSWQRIIDSPGATLDSAYWYLLNLAPEANSQPINNNDTWAAREEIARAKNAIGSHRTHDLSSSTPAGQDFGPLFQLT